MMTMTVAVVDCRRCWVVRRVMFILGNCSRTQGLPMECQTLGGLVTSAGHWEGGGCQHWTGVSLGVAVDQLRLGAVLPVGNAVCFALTLV